jgi:hypothetical protein
MAAMAPVWVDSCCALPRARPSGGLRERERETRPSAPFGFADRCSWERLHCQPAKGM